MNTYRTSTAAIAVATAILVTAAPDPASAQQMGRDPYHPGARNPSIAAQLEMQRRLNDGQSDSVAAFQQYVTSYNSSSTSIGNMNSVTQNVGDGASASVGQNTDQTATGNQGADASTDVSQTNNVNTSEALIEALENSGNSQ